MLYITIFAVMQLTGACTFNYECGSNAYCYNCANQGCCNCNSGYSGSPCSPINNCVTNNGGCDQICTYTGPGSSHCSCTSGYNLVSGRYLDPINNCQSNNGGCEQYCTYTGPAINICTCNALGFTLNSDGRTCSPINPCTSGNGGCEQICNYLGPGLSNCNCQFG